MTTLPTIHLNGTGATTLLDEYSEAMRALENLRATLADATCNARDFYPQGDTAWTDARYERAEVMAKISDIEDYLQAWLSHICDHL
ncbi:MAG: hypothetical protein ACO35C_06660 [Pontimonas sp.]